MRWPQEEPQIPYFSTCRHQVAKSGLVKFPPVATKELEIQNGDRSAVFAKLIH